MVGFLLLLFFVFVVVVWLGGVFWGFFVFVFCWCFFFFFAVTCAVEMLLFLMVVFWNVPLPLTPIVL